MSNIDEYKIPFEISSLSTITLEDGLTSFLNLRQSAKQNNLQNMTLEEINTEIQSTRKFS